MEQKVIKIKPVVVSLTDVVINSINVDYSNQRATITATIFNNEEQVGTNRFIELTTEEYAAWGDNDEYIIDLVLSKLQVVKA